MEKVKKLYKEAYKKYGKSPKSLFTPKARHEQRYELLTSHIKRDNFSLLDYGCGFGYLRKYLHKKFRKFDYLGVDIVDDFINEAKQEGGDFYVIQNIEDVKRTFDFICISGVFNTIYFDNIKDHETEVKRIIEKLFNQNLNDKGVLSIDFMHDQVDYIQQGAFHINIEEMYQFFISKLSKRIIINRSVFPYEVTFTIFKNTNISERSLYD